MSMNAINSMQALTFEEMSNVNGGGLKEKIKEHKSIGYLIMYALETASQRYQDEVLSEPTNCD